MRNRSTWFPLVPALLAFTILGVIAETLDAKGPQPNTSFTIQTAQDVGCWGDFGRFRASGAVKDRGDAITSYTRYPEYDLVLLGQRGNIMILIEDGLFLVADATGEPIHLIGAMGTAQADWNITDGYDLNGDCVYGKVQWTLEGWLP